MYFHKHMACYNQHCRHIILHPWFNQGEWLEWPIHVHQKS